MLSSLANKDRLLSPYKPLKPKTMWWIPSGMTLNKLVHKTEREYKLKISF